MTALLRIDASARPTKSITRDLADRFIEAWRSVEPEVKVVTRDVGQAPPPIVTVDWISAAFTPYEERTEAMHEALSVSDVLVDEVEQADVLLFAAPLYNYGLPASLKSWVDQVVRIGRVFSFDLNRGDFPIESTLGGKSAVVLSSWGEFGFHEGGPRDGWNHLIPHLKTLATKVFGVLDDDFHAIASEYQEFGGDRHKHSLEQARLAASQLGRELAECRLVTETPLKQPGLSASDVVIQGRDRCNQS